MTLGDARDRISALIDWAFVPREVFFRSGDRFRHIRLSVRLQKATAAAGAVLVTWLLYASGSFVIQGIMLASKNEKIEKQKLAYFDLLSEVGEYHNQFAKITEDLKQNQAYLLSLLEKDQGGEKRMAEIQERLKGSETEQARVVIAREGLRRRMEQFESDLQDIVARNMSLQSEVTQMQALVESSKAERDQVAAAREQLVDRLAQVERQLEQTRTEKRKLNTLVADLRGSLKASEDTTAHLTEERDDLTQKVAALETRLGDADRRQDTLEAEIAELNGSLTRATDLNEQMAARRAFLERRVGGLERRMVDLRDAEQTVIERLNERAKLSVETIEKTVQMTGLDVNALIKSAHGDLTGQGGPFVPADESIADFEPSVQLEASMSLLDQQLDRWTALQEVLRTLPLSAPLDQFRISSSYGGRKDPVNGRKARHDGVDFAARTGAPIYSTAPGKVVFAGWRGRFGRMIEIDHGHGVRTRYAHLRKILVKRGQKIENREKIGLVGSSGRSTGPHVHYEVRYEGRAQNPIKFLKAGDHVFKG